MPSGRAGQDSQDTPTPLGPSRQVPSTGPTRGGHHCPSDTTLAVTGVVPCPFPTSPGLSTAPTRSSRPANQSQPTIRDSSARQGQSTGRLAYLRGSYQGTGVSEEAISLLMSSWRDSTSKNYNSSWRKWELWCGGKGINPISPSLGNILNFMAAEYGSGRGYRSLNCYRSALSSVLAPIDGFDVGRHPLVCRLMKGVFQQRPPKPKHTAFWSVKVVLDHLSSWGDNDLLSLQRLSWKLAMLLALSSASRSSDLSRLSIDNHLCSGDSLTLHPLGLSKQSRAGHLPTPIQFKAYSGNKKLCPVHCFKAYDKATGNIRVPGHSGLLIAIKKPHLPVSSSTIARWLKTTLSSAGVDTTQFSAHSTRGAASSSAFMAGLTTKQILSTADWSSADTFKTFYLREADTSVRAPRQGFDVDTLLKASKSRCDMEPEPNDIQSQNG